MLSSDPLHAVQGPPGTGKTTLIAALVAEAVYAQDGSRVLVTSQNHSATDNVVLSVMSGLDTFARRRGREDEEGGVSAIRVFSEMTRESVDQDVLRHFSIEAQVQAIQKRMRGSVEVQRGEATLGSELAQAVMLLAKVASSGYLELRIKLERTAPIIFSTTGAAMNAFDYLRRGALTYDYVLIDEAAKGWAIDLVQAIALGDRVILVGDQAQLPPFGEIELDAVLQSAERRRGVFSVPPDIDFLLDETRYRETGETPFGRMKSRLKLFHHIFEKRPPDKYGRSNTNTIPLTQKLDRQFRSVPAIGSLVSDVFYGGTVRNAGPEPLPNLRIAIRLPSNPMPFSPAVMWLDTSEIQLSRFFHKQAGGGAIYNDGEAELVRAVLRNFRPAGGDSWKKLRVLSPYRAQVRNLVTLYRSQADALGVPTGDLSRLFQTVDSSQGTEADSVIISLCRRTALRDQRELPTGETAAAWKEALRNRINSSLGFLQQPERLNVMASRARQQLIFIGDFQYFSVGGRLIDQLAEIEVPRVGTVSFWTKLASAFKPFDGEFHLSPEGLERPVIVPARLLCPEIK